MVVVVAVVIALRNAIVRGARKRRLLSTWAHTPSWLSAARPTGSIQGGDICVIDTPERCMGRIWVVVVLRCKGGEGRLLVLA